MITKKLKELNRRQLERLLAVNFPEKRILKNTPLPKLHKKFNLLGEEEASITFTKDFNILIDANIFKASTLFKENSTVSKSLKSVEAFYLDFFSATNPPKGGDVLEKDYTYRALALIGF